MTKNSNASLSRLVDVRKREVDRLAADVATKQAISQRYSSNLERLERLYKGVGPSGATSPALSLNCAQYKQSVMQLADSHREDLALHQADMAVAQRVLVDASRRQEVLGRVLESRQEEQQRSADARRQKAEDDLAVQVWYRGQV